MLPRAIAIRFMSMLGLGWLLTLAASQSPAPDLAAALAGPYTITSSGASSAVYIPLVLRNANVDAIPSDGIASWGAPIAVSPRDGRIWVVNPDAGSVSVVAADNLLKEAEIVIGPEPWALALSPDGRNVYVIDRAAGELAVVEAATHQVRARVLLGPEPIAIALSPSGAKAYVTINATDEVVVLDTQLLEIVARISVDARPYAIVVTDDGDGNDTDERIYITHLQSFLRPGGVEATDDGREGHITVLEAATNTLATPITLAPDEQGFPSGPSGIALLGDRAWVPHVRAAPDLPHGLTQTVFAAVAALDLNQNAEDFSARLLLNDQTIFGSPVNNPVAAIPARDGRTLYVVLAGSDLIEVIDVTEHAQPHLIKFLPTGKNPRGLALNADGRRGYVMNYLSRSITVLDLEQRESIAEVPVTAETLDPEVLRGKIFFNTAANPKLSQGSWISCASCHLDEGTDGITWMFPDGPRQTPVLWNAVRTRPWHWSAALDESQDVESTIQLIQHGLGLAPGIDPPLLGTPHAGRAADLDALAAFLEHGIRVPAAPPPHGDITFGRSLFQSAGCAACHGEATWTSSALSGAAGTLDPDGNGMIDAVLRNVGTLNPRDVRGETGFDPPSVLNVGLTAPYLHDGSMPTLEALLLSGHPDPHDNGNGLDDEERAALIAFLRSIGPGTPPIDTR